MGEVKSVAKAHEREVVGPLLDVDEDAHVDLRQRLSMQQEEYDCDEDLLSMLVQDNPPDKEEEEQRANEELMEEFEVGMTVWVDEDNEVVVSIASSSAQPHLPAMNDVTSMSKNPFIDAYMKSIQPARDIICAQWSECIWDPKKLHIEPPSCDDEVDAMSFHNCCYRLC